MNIIEYIKRFFGKEKILDRKDIQRLKKMPKEQARSELGALLYDHCVKRAAHFVNGELKRGDSPYRGLSAALFFHEMLAVTFWIMDKEISGGKKKILHSLHDNYFRSYSSLDKSPEERNKSLLEKYNGYDDTWNDLTGHLDEFGLCVVQNICGKEESDRTRERTFWIISYADGISKSFSPLRKAYKEIISHS